MARKTLEVIPLAMHFKLSLTNAFPCQGQEDKDECTLLGEVWVYAAGTFKETCFHNEARSSKRKSPSPQDFLEHAAPKKGNVTGGSHHQLFWGVKMVPVSFMFSVTQNFRQHARAFREEHFYFLSKQKCFSASHLSCPKPASLHSLLLV